MPTPRTDTPLKVYWQPGCSSCLKTKEFLSEHGVAFVSVNVLADPHGYAELEQLGLRNVPVVSRGREFVSGQILADVARIAGIKFEPKMLPVAELVAKQTLIQAATRRALARLPESQLGTMMPNRPRSYAQLVYHIFSIAEAFLDHEAGSPLTPSSYNRLPPPEMRSRAQLMAYGDWVGERLDSWWHGPAQRRDFNAPAEVYYGKISVHDYLERSCWHAGQHLRQLQLVLNKLGVPLDQPLTDQDFAGLPMPRNVWDDKLKFE